LTKSDSQKNKTSKAEALLLISFYNIFDVYLYFQLQNKKRGGCRCNAKQRSRNDGQLGPTEPLPAKPLPAKPLPAELCGRAGKRNFWPAGDYKLTSSES
jgi:hypothetical protein